MSMKKPIISFLLAISFLAGCEDLFIGSLFTEDDYFLYEHRTTAISFVQDLYVVKETSEYYSKQYDLSVDVSIEKTLFQIEVQGEDKILFDSICEKYGDVDYNHKALKTGGAMRIVNPDISAIIITSDSDYDENHPVGANLADCFKVYGSSCYKLFQPCRDELPSGINMSDLNADDLKMLGPSYPPGDESYSLGVLKIKVDILPTKTQEHNLTFVITDEYGKSYTSTINYDFSECLLAGKKK